MQTVAELSQRSGINMPEVGIFPSYQSNAFATGWNKNDALVAVSSGLLERMNKDELRAVLAHEIGHVANGDMVTLALIQGVVNAFVMFFARVVGDFIDRNVFGRQDDEAPGMGYFIITMVLDELPYNEIAEISGISEGNLRVKIHRIKQKLTEIYNQHARV
mgnify:CR=1 FL=1